MATTPVSLPDPSEIPVMMADMAVRPLRRMYVDFDDDGNVCGLCAISTIVAQKVTSGIAKVKAHKSWAVARCELHFPEETISGVIDGFDGEMRVDLDNTDIDINGYLDGYAYGVAAWQACVAAGLVTTSEGER